MKKLIVLIYAVLCTSFGYSQCNVQSNSRSDGSLIRYLRPELVASNEKLEIGLSLQTNGSNYYIGTIIRCLSIANAPGDLTISNDLNQTTMLKLYHLEKSYMKGSEIYLAMYLLPKKDIKRLISSNLKYITFKTSDKILNVLKVSKNNDVIINQYKCLSTNN